MKRFISLKQSSGQLPTTRNNLMGIVLKTPEEIEAMRVAGHLAGEVLRMIREHVRVGVTTGELDDICHAYITEEQQAIPAPLNYRGFPKSICTSINQVVCHGIPGDKKLKNGDILNIDITVIKDGWHGDTSKMFLVGKPTIKGKRICDIAHRSMVTGIEMVRPGVRLGDIGHAIQKYAESQGCSVVREYCGHGIGEGFHEDPQVLHFFPVGFPQKAVLPLVLRRRTALIFLLNLLPVTTCSACSPFSQVINTSRIGWDLDWFLMC